MVEHETLTLASGVQFPVSLPNGSMMEQEYIRNLKFLGEIHIGSNPIRPTNLIYLVGKPLSLLSLLSIQIALRVQR